MHAAGSPPRNPVSHASRRWSGVPWFVRTGKLMASTSLEAVIELKPTPTLLFAGEAAPRPHPNLIRFRLGGDGGVSVSIGAQSPDIGQGVDDAFEERSEGEAAAVLGCGVDTVRAEADVALEALRTALPTSGLGTGGGR